MLAASSPRVESLARGEGGRDGGRPGDGDATFLGLRGNCCGRRVEDGCGGFRLSYDRQRRGDSHEGRHLLAAITILSVFQDYPL
jgi:hypothetical protein